MNLKRKLARLADRAEPLSRSNPGLEAAEIASDDGQVPFQSSAAEGRTAFRQTVDYLEPEHHHGEIKVSRVLDIDPMAVAGLALDAQFADVDVHRALFLDTETTGLGGGTGVIPFLIGLGWFEGGALVVEQLVLEELGDEEGMLARVHECLEWASCLVTYNGKSYDWPLLKARAIMNRCPSFPERPHLDLLHCSRRVYRPRLRRVRLVDMETEVLGMRREHDVDGAEIPEIYWRYLREGHPEILSPTIEHNAHDVVALTAILAVLAEKYAELHQGDDPRDQLARAKVGFRCFDFAKAEGFALAAAEGGGQLSVTAEAYELLARVRVRCGDLIGAQDALTAGICAVDTYTHLAAPLHLELAKLLEHRLKQPELALEHARMTARIEGPEGQAKRVARLERKLLRRVAASQQVSLL